MEPVEDSTPTEPPCDTADGTQDRPSTLTVAIYYGKGHREAAAVVRAYADYAITHAFGDEYDVSVWVADAIPLDINDIEEWVNHVNEMDDTAADCNHLITQTPDWYGCCDHSIAGGVKKVPRLDTCVSRIGTGDVHRLVNKNLHEIGHCLGMSHKTDSKYIHGPSHPMSTGYIEDTHHIHEYHEDSQAELDTRTTD